MELDFLYPSEGIHRRWDNGYRITSTAATYDQAAFVLSIPRRKPADETQETLRTSDFPSTHVKVNTAVDCAVSIVLCDLNAYICHVTHAGEMVKEPLYCIYLLWKNSFISREAFRDSADIILTSHVTPPLTSASFGTEDPL